MSNRFLYQHGASDYARETTQQDIQDTLQNGIINVSLAGGVANNVDLIEIGSNAVNTQNGNIDTGTIRVCVADDDTNLSAIKTSLDLIDNAVVGSTLDISLDSANITGNIPVDINANTIGLATETTLSTISTNTTGLNNLSKNTGIIDANSLRVNIATDDNVSTKLTSIDTDTGNIATSTSNIDGNTSSIDTVIQGFAKTDGSGISRTVMIAGSNGGNHQFVNTDGSRNLSVNIAGQALANLQVQSNSANIATETTLSSLNTNLTNVPNAVKSDGVTATHHFSIGGTTSINQMQHLRTNDSNALWVDINSQSLGNVQVQSNSANLATETTLSTVSTNTTGLNNLSKNSGNSDANTLRQTIANDDSLKTENYDIRKFQNSTSPVFEIYMEFSNFTATSYTQRPDSFDSGETNTYIVTSGTSLEMASSNSGDTSINMYIEGYNDSGVRVSETLQLDVTDSQTPVTSANSNYIHVTKFRPADDPQNFAGIISLARSAVTWTTGNPSDAITQIPIGNKVNNGHITAIHIPTGLDLVIHELEYGLVEGSSNQQLQFVKTPMAVGNVYTNARWEIINKYIVTNDKKFIKYDGGLIVPNLAATDEMFAFHIYGLNTESAGVVSVRCKYSFL